MSAAISDPGRRGDWLIAPDKFKGTYTAREVAAAIAGGLGDGAGVELCPLADGGEGTIEALLGARGGELAVHAAHDPLGRPIEAAIGLLDGGARAVVEVARASGLALLDRSELDPEAASTLGTGELIAAALAAGARSILLAAGGSATTDGGAGAIEAIEAAGGLRGAELIVLADVDIPFERAAEVFAPQKGAAPAAVERLRARLQRQAASLPRDPRGIAMGGAAGGLAGGLWARYGASILPGAGWVLDAVGFDERLARAAAVITGEGRLDATTLHGKVVFEVARRARRLSRPAHAIVGSCTLSAEESAQLALASVRCAGSIEQLEAAARSLAAHGAAQ